jgi:hypothetical protein
MWVQWLDQQWVLMWDLLLAMMWDQMLEQQLVQLWGLQWG